mmetsp:Transcript_17720/g.24939  ORF Transcript_17720/g.24939 Transcript_17720/m.24939 type:complete len:322 (-) Transcript_17720:316-1281(-)
MIFKVSFTYCFPSVSSSSSSQFSASFSTWEVNVDEFPLVLVVLELSDHVVYVVCVVWDSTDRVLLHKVLLSESSSGISNFTLEPLELKDFGLSKELSLNIDRPGDLGGVVLLTIASTRSVNRLASAAYKNAFFAALLLSIGQVFMNGSEVIVFKIEGSIELSKRIDLSRYFVALSCISPKPSSRRTFSIVSLQILDRPRGREMGVVEFLSRSWRMFFVSESMCLDEDAFSDFLSLFNSFPCFFAASVDFLDDLRVGDRLCSFLSFFGFFTDSVFRDLRLADIDLQLADKDRRLSDKDRRLADIDLLFSCLDELRFFFRFSG